MKMNALKKLENRSGFTLAEVLLAILIMLMVATIMTTGIPAAKNAYEKVIIASNAEVLMSTTISTLRNELSTAEKVELLDNKTIKYYSPSRTAYSRIFRGAAVSGKPEQGQEIKIIRYDLDTSMMTVNEIAEMTAPADEQLISSGMATENLRVCFETVEYKDNVVTFKGLSVYRAVGNKVGGSIVERDYSVRVISP